MKDPTTDGTLSYVALSHTCVPCLVTILPCSPLLILALMPTERLFFPFHSLYMPPTRCSYRPISRMPMFLGCAIGSIFKDCTVDLRDAGKDNDAISDKGR